MAGQYFQITPCMAEDFGRRILGGSSEVIESVCRLDWVTRGALAFAAESRLDTIPVDQGGAVLCPESFEKVLLEHYGGLPCKTALVLVENPALCFVRLLEENGYSNAPTGNAVASNRGRPLKGVDVYIESDTQIGQGVEMFHGACIMSGTVIGDRCRVQSGAVLGAVGLGYAVDGDHYIRFPHLGGVRIGNDVDIGPSASIAKGILQDTVIGSGSKIAANVTVGHNVTIGRDCFVSAGATLSGGVTLEDGCWIAPNATVLNGVVLARRTKIGIGAVVYRSTVKGHLYLGNPARSFGPRKD